MKNILIIIKNNMYRFVINKGAFITIMTILPILVVLGIYFGQLDGIKGNIAIVGGDNEEIKVLREVFKDNEEITYKFLENSPTRTDLIKGIYLAEINIEGKEPKVISYGKEEIKLTLEAALKGEVYEGESDNATVLAKIVGFLTMFLIMGGVMMMDSFLIDRKTKVYSRVLSGNVSYYEYVLGQMLYALICLFLSTSILSVAVIKVLNVDIGINMIEFTGIILLISIVCTSYGVFISNIFKSDMTVNMTAGNLAMLTSILGGCVINVSDSNKIIGFIRNFIPQKRLIDFASNFNINDLIFLIVISAIFIFIAIVVGKKHYNSGEFA